MILKRIWLKQWWYDEKRDMFYHFPTSYIYHYQHKTAIYHLVVSSSKNNWQKQKWWTCLWNNNVMMKRELKKLSDKLSIDFLNIFW